MARPAQLPAAPLLQLPLKKANGWPLPPPAPHSDEAIGGNSSWEALQDEMLVIDDVGRASDFLSGRFEPGSSLPRMQQQQAAVASAAAAEGGGSLMPIDLNTAR